MLISLIAAMSRNYVIGYEDKLPWNIPHELKRFKTLTMGKPIIMGNTTHKTIGKPHSGRPNIVLSRDRATNRTPKIRIAHTLIGALAIAEECARWTDHNETVVIGGAEVYKTCLPVVQRMYLSIVDGDYKGDVFFPGLIPNLAHWTITKRERVEADPDKPECPGYTFFQLEKTAQDSAELMPFIRP